VNNLFNNSVAHAFPDGRHGEIAIAFIDEGERVKIKYQDNGVGIKAEHLAHIFEPFYTTKRGQGGTGLGMHIVYNLVTQSLEGSIECKSDGELGATFEICMKKSLDHSD